MGKGERLSWQSKELIASVVQTFEGEKARFKDKVQSGALKHSEIPVDYLNVAARTAKTMKVSESTVKRIHSELKSWGYVVPPKTKRIRQNTKVEIDSFTEGVIRRAVLFAYSNKIFPNMDYLHKTLQEDPRFPRMSRSTLHKVMKRQLKFKYGKFDGKPVPMDRPDIAADRAQYLRLIKQFRANGFKIYYQDESWVNENHSVEAGWHIPEDEVIGNDRCRPYSDPWLRGVGHRFTDRLVGGISSKPSGAGKRIILLHVGSEDGFLSLGKEFIGKKDSSDYHQEMTSAHFNEWITEVMAELPDQSVIVLDKASYHRAITEESKTPTAGTRKHEIIAWLVQKQVPVPREKSSFEQMTVVELLKLAKNLKIQRVLCVEKILEAENAKAGKRGGAFAREIHLLWLPVAHCELNAIELMWSLVKGEIRKRNTTFKIKDVLNLAKEVIQSPEINQQWIACCRHVIELENLIFETEKLATNFVTQNSHRLIIHLGSGTSSDTSSSSDSSGEE